MLFIIFFFFFFSNSSASIIFFFFFNDPPPPEFYPLPLPAALPICDGGAQLARRRVNDCGPGIPARRGRARQHAEPSRSGGYATWSRARSSSSSRIASSRDARSEEHTSELQSQSNLVCRLLLEKKNK